MEMQVQLPASIDFDFNLGRESPCISSPPSPKGFGSFYCSAPTSPGWGSEIYSASEFNDFSQRSISALDGKGSQRHIELSKETSDFTFADTDEPKFEGKIRPSRASPPHGGTLVAETGGLLLPPQSPAQMRSEHKSIWSTISSRRKKQSPTLKSAVDVRITRVEQVRGRESVSTLSKSKSRRREARSLSPERVSKYPWEEEQQLPHNAPEGNSSSNHASSTALMVPSSARGSRKWSFRDFLLFRSASEGRASDKDPFKKNAYLYRKHEVARTSGSPLTGSPNNVPVSRNRVSAHELHYTVNKESSQEMKKKSFLPYKQGILGRLAFNPTVHALAHGFGSLSYSHR